MITTSRGKIFQGIEGETGTRFFKEHHRKLVEAGETDMTFRAWAAEMGIVVSSDGGWDDARRRRVLSLDQLLGEQNDGRSPFNQTRISQINTDAGGRRNGGS